MTVKFLKDDIIKQAKWEIELEQFEREVEKEKQRILNKKQLHLKGIYEYKLYKIFSDY